MIDAGGYRGGVTRCRLCELEVRPDELRPKAGLAICARCRAGDLDGPLQRWQLQLTQEVRSVHRLVVEVQRPARCGILAWVTGHQTWGDFWRQLIKGSGRRIIDLKHASFERNVRVKPEAGHEAMTARLLEQPEVRPALLDLVCLGAKVDIMYEGLMAVVHDPNTPTRFPEVREVTVPLVALAIAIDRLTDPTDTT